MTSTSKDKRDAMLGELESIRRLLQEDSQDDQDRDLLVNASNIPILMPELDIPTLLPDGSNHSAHIPVLTANPLDTMRVAAAKVAANAVRHHRNTGKETPTPASENIAQKNTEQLVDDIVRNALPRIETLLREIVREALEKEKP